MKNLTIFFSVIFIHSVCSAQNFTLVSSGDAVNDAATTYPCVMTDFNNDSLPDLFTGDFSAPDRFYLNVSHNFVFQNLSGASQNTGASIACTAGDYDNDGYTDLFVSTRTVNNRLYKNGPTGLTQVNIPPITNFSSGNSYGASWVDYDNDGNLDLFLCIDGGNQRMYHNNGGGTFSLLTTASFYNDNSSYISCSWSDYDNDGDPDLFLANNSGHNALYRNDGAGVFTKITNTPVTADSAVFDGGSWADIDNDGDQDIFCKMGGAYIGDKANNLLFENPNEDLNNWVTISVSGKTIKCGIGSRIKVNVITKAGDKRSIYVNVNSGGTFGASSLQQEIGLGQAKEIESVEVFWQHPGFPSTKYTGIALNSFVKLTEGSDKPEVQNRKKIKLSTDMKGGHEHSMQ